jgi:hypothetical protein
MLLAKQKLSMLKALEESSLRASIVPSMQTSIADLSENEDEELLPSPAFTSTFNSSEVIRLKFMAKSKQPVSSVDSTVWF